MKTVWINDSLHDSYKQAADKQGRSIAKLIQLALTKSLNDIQDSNKVEKDLKMFNEE
jgi:hypothetical protein